MNSRKTVVTNRKTGASRFLRCLFCLAMICSLAVISPMHAEVVQAKAKVSFDSIMNGPEAWTVAPVRDDNYTGQTYIDIDAVRSGAKVKKLKSSNKKVATVKATSSGICITYGLRTGKTKISCVVRGVKLSRTFTVKYTCPASTFKVDGKSVLSKLKKKNVYVTSQTLQNKKVTVKAKKGWVITEVTNVKNGSGKTKTYKKKTSYTTKITTNMPYDGICIKFKNKKTGMEQTLKFRKRYDSYMGYAG